jgi:uncharacterized protein (DUF885 family)
MRLACVLMLVLAPIALGADRAETIQASQTVPADLKPLLVAPASEFRLIPTRYNADRNTLSGNYAGQTGRGGGGRGGGRAGGGGAGGGEAAPAAAAQAPAGPVPFSAGRLARLKRFDLDWQAALAKLDTSKLSPQAKTEFGNLASSVNANLQQIENDALTMAQVTPALPFAARLVGLIEARIRVVPMNAQKAAETTVAAVKDIKDMRAALETNAATAPKLNKAIATRAADATSQIRGAITEWFNFYNGYDPMFTWWVGMPFKQLDTALQDYATFLRDKVAAADAQVPASPATVPPVPPDPAPKYASVPNLAEIIALPQDELRDVVARFNAGRPGGGRGGRGGRAGGADAPAPAAPAAPPDNSYYTGWLAALPSLDFDRLSRNAQVDYLYIKWTSETEIKRTGTVIPPGPPRKADTSDVQGRPRGRAGLIQDLQDNMIPYTPEQLIVLANKEFAWCEEEMKKASRALGYGDDWKKAIEHTKQTAVPPGEQPQMIMGLIDEAVAYLRANDLITVPAIAAETVHMTMMSPQQQLTSPFFLGGVGGILVSYPTDTMEYDARLQSMRGNNPGFSHATAFHETIPGHLLVGYLGQRFSDYRPDLRGGGPFYGEGWPLYWELTMYDLGFDKTPEQKIGALFWRMHRCARIIFSLSFHMGLWSPQESVDFLVDKVGHERDNATAEVRRSFESAQYANQPLYQAAYLLGGLQFRGLRKQLVDSKIMTNKQFHDEILRQGNMPIALIRLAVTREKLTRDMDISWKFYGELPEK